MPSSDKVKDRYFDTLCIKITALLWWRRRGSNSRPYGCEPYALPAELRPQINHGYNYIISHLKNQVLNFYLSDLLIILYLRKFLLIKSVNNALYLLISLCNNRRKEAQPQAFSYIAMDLLISPFTSPLCKHGRQKASRHKELSCSQKAF